MQYQLVRSRRRTVALVIDRQGNLVVRAPKRTALSDIEYFIQQKQEWIAKHQQVVKAAAQPKEFVDGERHWFLGEQRQLRVTNDYRSKLVYEAGEFSLSRFQAHKAKSLFADWYRGQAQTLLPQR